MRLDKLLKNARLLKRRTAAKREADGGHVLVNGRPAKPGRDVGPGDVLTLREEDPMGRLTESDYEVLLEPLRPVPKGEEARYLRPLPRP